MGAHGRINDRALVLGILAGKTRKALAEELGVSMQSVSYRLRTLRVAGVALPTGRRRVDVGGLNALIAAQAGVPATE